MPKINLNPLYQPTIHRLSTETRALAQRYLAGEFRFRLQPCGFSVGELQLPEDTAPEIRHGKNAVLTAQKSRIYILPEERLAGNASNMEAIEHLCPGFTVSGQPVYSISHTTVDFGNALRLGLAGLEQEILTLKTAAADCKQPFYEGLLEVIRAMRLWTSRYIDACRALLQTPAGKAHRNNLLHIISMLENVPENPPASFPEAVQSLWIFFAFQRICGNWSGLGRIDEYLYPYLKADLENSRTTLDEAREYLAHFWIKGTEWCFGLLANNQTQKPGSGDAQNYQNIILSGINADGEQIENEVTFLVLDIIEELHISDYPVTVRLNKHTSEHLFRRIAEIQLLGGGIVSVYNEAVVLKALARIGITGREACNFSNDGCWEIIIPGQTRFSYQPIDVLMPFQEALFADQTPADFTRLYDRFLQCFSRQAEKVKKSVLDNRAIAGKNIADPGSYPAIKYDHADVVLSLLMPSCRVYGCSYSLNGAKYILQGLHMAGLPDVANSLFAIQKLVFEKKRITLPELVQILKNDWQDNEALRLEFAHSLSYYGNDNPEADAVLQKVFHDCCDILSRVGQVNEVKTVVGVSTFGREIAFAPQRLATAFGKHAHEYLAPNLSPTPGTDKSPLTAVLNSYCRMDFTKTPNGCPLDLRLAAGIRKHPGAADLLAQVLRVFLDKGGFYLQIDTVNPDILRAAQKAPDSFPNLVVRISGWSARFASLSTEWQNMLINRTALEWQ